VGFRESLAAAKQHVAEERIKTVPIPVVVDGEIHEVVFYRASTADWAAAAMKHPPRPGIALDQRNGYNLTAATREIAPEYGRILEDGTEVELTVEEWADFWEVMAPAASRTIEANVWHVHEFDAEQEILRAKKASRPRRNSRSKPS
jgi:hypothetical protein